MIEHPGDAEHALEPGICGTFVNSQSAVFIPGGVESLVGIYSCKFDGELFKLYRRGCNKRDSLNQLRGKFNLLVSLPYRQQSATGIK